MQGLAGLLSSRERTSIRSRILSLVALILVPVTLLFAAAVYNVASAKRELIEADRMQVTNRVSAAVDQEISVTLGMLMGLATTDDLVQGAFGPFLKQAGVVGRQPHVLSVWAFSGEGNVVSATVPGASRILEAAMLEKVRKGEVAVSDVHGEGVANASVVIAVPDINSRNPGYGIAASMNVAPFSRLFAENGMGTQWIAAIVDRNGRFVARSLDAEGRVGTLARSELRAAAQGQAPTGVFENVTHENLRVGNAFHRSALTGWTTVVAVPKTELAAPLQRAVTSLLLGGAAVLAGIVVLALTFATRISEPVRSLSSFAAALGGGAPYQNSKYHIQELDEVREALERAMAQSARLSALVASSGDAIMSIDLDGTIRTWNKGAENLFGYAEEDIIGLPKTVLVPADHLAEFEAQRARVLAGESIRTETVRLKRDGKRVDVSLETAPIRHSDGKIIAVSSIIQDITERRASEEHSQFLIHELAHRSKNQLAIIQSIASQTARGSGSMVDFLEAFRRRLRGLAASHDLLSSQNWRPVRMDDLIKRQLQVFSGTGATHIQFSGPEIRLGAAAAEAIGLAFHELATNSIKHGSLSVPSGRVDVRWETETGAAGEAILVLDWKESGGPAVQAPSSKGFGSRVIEDLVARTLNGVATIAFDPGGVHWRLECPIDGTIFPQAPRTANGHALAADSTAP